MKLQDYFNRIDQEISKINPSGDTHFIKTRLMQSISASALEEIIFFTHIIKDPVYNGLIVESLLATKNSISDILIGVNSLRYSTTPISRIKNTSFELLPIKIENTQSETYTIRLKILWGSHNQVYQYTTPVDKFEEILKLKNELDKLTCR
jgi:hypothetical protein